MKIRSVEAIPLHMSLHASLIDHLYRSSHTGQNTLYRLTLQDGTVGYGEAMNAPEDVERYAGQDAIEGLRRIAHPGIQMACYDAVGKSLGVPAHVLMGRQVRDRVPFAYWTIDLPPHVLAEHVQRAVELGYRTYKFKCRPWWDPMEQMRAAQEVAPAGFELWLDFNGHLREARLALPILLALQEFECVGGFESPIPQRDAAGYRELRSRLDLPIAAHMGSGCCHVETDRTFDRGVPALQQIEQRLCDGFVVGGTDVESVRQRGAIADEGRVPFWLQTTGGRLRAAWVAHLVSTCRAGTLAHLAAHDVWAEDVTQPLRMEAGAVVVPVEPGLGLDVNEEAVDRLRRAEPIDHPRHITTTVYPDGTRWHFADEIQRHETYYFGSLPGFVPGVRTEVWTDDGSDEFQALFERSTQAPVTATDHSN